MLPLETPTLAPARKKRVPGSLSISSAMRRGGVALVTGVLAFAVAGCGSSGNFGAFPAARVRFVQVSPGAPEMDFFVRDAGAAYQLSYESYTSYLPVSPGDASFSASRAGSAQSLAGTQMMLAPGRQYTAVLVHGLGSLEERLYPDQDTPATPGQTALRVLNEVEGTGALQVYVSATDASGQPSPLRELTVLAGAASAYLELPAGVSYTVVSTTNHNSLNLPLGSVTLKAVSGATRTVVFAGVAHGESHRVVGFTLNDADAL